MIAEFTTAQFVRLTPEQKDQLKKLASRLDISPSAVIRLALTEKWEATEQARKRKRAGE
jgi:predicted transcriptional regulator